MKAKAKAKGKEPQARRFVGYCRVSTQEQARHGVSLEDQAGRIGRFVDLLGGELIEIVTDPGVSGGKDLATRPGGARVAAMIRAGEVDAVVAIKLDRLFRDTQDCLAQVSDWTERGVDLCLLDLGGQPLDTSSPFGRFFLTVLAATTELERSLIRERIQRTMDHLGEQGKLRNQYVPYGYTLLEGNRIVPVEAEQAVVAEIRAMAEAGMGRRAIARDLTERGVPAPGRIVSRWSPNTVRRVIEREAA